MNRKPNALDELLAFKNMNPVPRDTAGSYLVNTGRLVEFDADPDVIEVHVFRDNQPAEKVFLETDEFLELVRLETDEFLELVRNHSGNHTYQIDDRNGGTITRRIDLKFVKRGFRLYAAEKVDGKWRALGGTTRPGCTLTPHEFFQLVALARLESAYGAQYKLRRATESVPAP